jgi:hypothetical protein
METTIILTKDGFLTKEWNSDKREYETKPLKFNMGFFRYWRSNFEIEEGVTLLDLINVIKGDSITLLEMLTQSSIAPFIEEMDKENNVKDDLKAMEIKKYYRTSKYSDGSNEFSEEIHCSGVYKEPYVDDNGIENKQCAIEFTPWSYLKKLPIIINDKATLADDADYHNQKHYDVYFSVSDFFTGLTDG